MKRLEPNRLLRALAAATLLAGVACSSGTDDDAASTPAADQIPDPSEGQGDITIVDFGFEPEGYDAVVGDDVVVANGGNTTHTVTADDDSFDSGELAPGEEFVYSAGEAGEFTYHCEIHSSMTGTITVTEA